MASVGLERAIDWAVATMESEGLEVRKQPVMVPHWVRGDVEEVAMVVPREQRMAVTSLGGSVPTPDAGLEAEVVIAHDFDELPPDVQAAFEGGDP